MKELQHKEQRVAVLIDIQNMYYSAKHLFNTKVNFKEIMNTAVAGRRLVRAIGYAIRADVKDECVFHNALNKVGIEVKAKDLLVFHGGAKKGDWDIGIAMDAIRLSEKIDCLILVSGDGDFKDLLVLLKQRGIRTEVIAFNKTASIQIKQEADLFVDMEKDKKKYLIGYKPGDKGIPKHDHKKTDYNKKVDYTKNDNKKTDFNKKVNYTKNDNKKTDFNKKVDYTKNDNKKTDFNKRVDYKKTDYTKPDYKKNSYSSKPFVKSAQRLPRIGDMQQPQLNNNKEGDMADLFGDEAPVEKIKKVESKPKTEKKAVKKVEPKTEKKAVKKVEPKTEKKVEPKATKKEDKKETKKPAKKKEETIDNKKTEKKPIKKKKEGLLAKLGKKLKGK